MPDKVALSRIKSFSKLSRRGAFLVPDTLKNKVLHIGQPIGDQFFQQAMGLLMGLGQKKKVQSGILPGKCFI